MPGETARPADGAAFWDEHYAANADRADRATGDPLTASPDLAAIIAAGHIPAGGVTLDVGCGAGRDAIFLASLGFRSIGLDLSSKAIGIARSRASEAGVVVDWREGSVLELPFGDASVHFAQDRGCFHHIAPADRERYASELARVLVPGARFLLILGHDADAELIDRTFSSGFARGGVVPYRAHSDAEDVPAYLAFLERR